MSHGLLDQGELPHLWGAESGVEAVGFGVDAALAAGLGKECAQLGACEFGCLGGGGCGGQKCAGDGGAEAFAQWLDGGEEAGEVGAQVGAEFVAGLGAVPDGVLLGSGQDGDGLGELAVVGEGPVSCGVGAQDVGQDHGVEVVGLLAGDRVPVAVAGGGHRVDGVDGALRGAEAGHEQAAGGLDRHRNRSVFGVSVCGEQVEELVQAGGVVADAGSG